MGTAISKSTIESNSHKNVYEKVNDRTLVSDPRHIGSTAVLRRFVYYSDPLHKEPSFADFPYIVVNSPTIDYSNVSSNGKVKRIIWTHEIVVRTVKDGASNTPNNFGVNKGMQDMWSICDDLHSLFNTETNKAAFRTFNMYKMNLVKETFNDDMIIKDKVLYETVFRLTYEERLTVSS